MLHVDYKQDSDALFLMQMKSVGSLQRVKAARVKRHLHDGHRRTVRRQRPIADNVLNKYDMNQSSKNNARRHMRCTAMYT